MPSFVHEQAIHLLESDPEVLRELCSWVGITQPGHDEDLLQVEHPELRIDVGILRDVRQLRPDLLVRELNELFASKVASGASKPADPAPPPEPPIPEFLALWLIDLQASKDESRPDAWIVYVILIAYFFKIEPSFVIIALGREMESWCRRQVQQHKRLRAEENIRIIGPSTLAGKSPANPRVAALSALIYRQDATQDFVERTVEALRATGNPADIDHIRMVLAAVHEDVAKAVMDKMQREYEMGEIEYDSYFYKHGVSVGREEGVAKGRAEGEAKGREAGRAEGMVLALLTMLRARGVEISDQLRAALTECHDLGILERLAARANQVAHGDELVDCLARNNI